MKTKFGKSNIQISGQIIIKAYNEEKVISLGGLNKSKSGVYEIVNKFNGKRYIGMSRNMEVRRARHINDLLRGIHESKEMQNDYNMFTVGGIINAGNPLISGKILDISPDWIFEFNVIKYCRPSELTFWENLLIKHLNPEYNTHKDRELGVEFQYNDVLSEDNL